MEDCAMEVSAEVIDSGINVISSNTTPDAPIFFANLTSFGHANQWRAVNSQIQMENFDQWHCEIPELIYTENGNYIKPTESPQSPHKPFIDANNKNLKQSSSLFQMAKTFCGNIMKKNKSSIEIGLDEITAGLAALQFTA